MNPFRSSYFRSRRPRLQSRALQRREVPGAQSWPGGVMVLVVAGFLAVAAPPRPALAQCDREWAKGFGVPGVDGQVYATTVFNDGRGDALYVGGWFQIAGNDFAANIAKWDGTTWSALGSGMDGDDASVSALTVFDDGNGPALYAGGNFTSAGGVTANNIAKWNGSTWSALGEGLGGDEPTVDALTVFDDGSGPALYTGGNFTIAGEVSANNIAKWNGTTWSAVGSWLGGRVYALTVFDDDGGPALYAGGWFTTTGEVSANSVAKWNGKTWSALGFGINGRVYALTSFDDGSGPALFAGGQFITAGGESANSIAKWNGSNWSRLGSGLSHEDRFGDDFEFYANAMTVFDDGGGPALYVGGYFTTAGSLNVAGIAKWDGTNWSTAGTAADSELYFSVDALAVFDDGNGLAMYVAGAFGHPQLLPGSGISKWNGAAWSSLGPGLDSYILDLTVFDDGNGPALYAGGGFINAGDVGANYIAKWNGMTWSALGSGLNGSVEALTVFDDGTGPSLYAGGSFRIAGGVSAANIAKWDGAAWSSLGSGTRGPVYALTVFDDGGGPALYAGGNFTSAGSAPNVRYLARWDGTTWSGLGSPIGTYVSVLTVFDDGGGPALYAGGRYTPVSAPVKVLAKWDGTTWSALGSGISGQSARVSALTVFDDGDGPALYAGGIFDSAGGVSVINIAKWNGTSWLAVRPLSDKFWFHPRVNALTVFDDAGGPALYAGGQFSTAFGAVANFIAKWNPGSPGTWSALGTGLGGRNASVATFAEFDDGGGPALYAGGTLTTAGGHVSGRLAKWSCMQLDSCGDGVCEAALQEHCGNCAEDCRCESCERCHDGVCVDSCGDGICDDACGENPGTCPTDCRGCGDEDCDPSTEDSCSCELDCGPPTSEDTPAACDNEVDDDCDGLTDCQDSDCTGITPCPGDCEVGTSECAVHSDCVDNIFCNGTESCDAGCCAAGTNPCERPSTCDESARTCRVCPAQQLLAEDESAAEEVTLIRRYRDEILASTPRGRWYIEEFYANGIEVTRILLRRPLLARELRGLLIDNLSIVEAAVEGRLAVVSSKTIRTIRSLLAKIRAEGGVRLRSALAELNRDLNDRKQLAILGVRLEQSRRGGRGN